MGILETTLDDSRTEGEKHTDPIGMTYDGPNGCDWKPYVQD